jgi:CRP-like cAMP-binding protein
MREYNFGPPEVDLRPPLPIRYVRILEAVGQLQRFIKDAHLYRQGEYADCVHLLQVGKVKATSVNALGEETLLRVHLPGSLLGLTALAPEPVRDANGVAMETVETVGVKRDVILDILQSDGRLALYVTQLLLERLLHFQYRLNESSASSVEQRLARVLLELAQQGKATVNPQSLDVALSHEDLAHIINARRQTVTATLNRFATAGLIRCANRRIHVLDRHGLARLAPGPAGFAVSSS